MSPEAKARIKVICGLLLVFYLIGMFLMLGPHVLKTFVGGSRYIRLSPYEQSFTIVERSWWFGETRTYRLKRVRNEEEPDMMNWVERLEKKGDKNISVDSKEGDWSGYIYNDDEGAIAFDIWVMAPSSED